jgi:glucokinase
MQKGKTILTLDAGGTNLVFKTVVNGIIQTQSVTIPAHSNSLDELLQKIISGFKKVNETVSNKADAISFCFPEPADYENGIIGDLENLPAFRGGVALKNMLENEFQIPVFINNDGDLFTLGEAIGGFLPEVNKRLAAAGVQKRYQNLLGITLGTGFGGGIVNNGQILTGDNSAGAEINRMVNPFDWHSSIEETLTIRGIKKLFSEETGISFKESPEPFDIFQIGMGNKLGDKGSAIRAWERFGVVLADAIANANTLIDGITVIGGGLSGAYPLFLPKTIEMLNRKFKRTGGCEFPRMEVSAFSFEDEKDILQFLDFNQKMIAVPFSSEKVPYCAEKKTVVGISRLGTSEAVALGAYALAVDELG